MYRKHQNVLSYKESKFPKNNLNPFEKRIEMIVSTFYWIVNNKYFFILCHIDSFEEKN